MAIRAKQWETRSWATNYRGRIAIHAAKKLDGDTIPYLRMPFFKEALLEKGYDELEDFPLGMIIAVGDLTEVITTTEWMRRHCVRQTEVMAVNEREHAFGNYDLNRFAWHVENIRILVPGIPCRGRQRLWNLDDATGAEVERLAA